MKKINRSSSFCMCFKISSVMENGFDFHQEEPPSKGVKSVLSSPEVNMMGSDSEGMDDVVDSSCRKNKFGRRKFSRYVKAVLFETSLVKKMRNKKSEQSGKAKSKKNPKLPKPKPNPSNNISLISDQKSCNDDHEDNYSTSYSPFTSSNLCSTSPTSTNSASSSAKTSRCSSSSMSSSLLLPSEGSEKFFTNNLQGKLKFGKGKCYGFHAGTILLLISLFVLVMWGKICAILCTSTWLFLTIRRGFKHSSSGNNNAVDLHHQFSDIDAEKYYRKKVIMEGLLERNHTRSLYKS